MRRGEAWKPLREHGKWMRLSERAVFHALLERSNNADCAIPAHMTPSLVQLAEACCCSKSTVALALDHLEAHGWVTRKRSGKGSIGKPGRGYKTTYQLDHGWLCPSGCKRHRPEKGSDSRTLSGEKGSDSRTAKGSDSALKNSRSEPVSDEGIAAGRERGGKREESRSGTTPETCWPDLDQQWLDAHPFDAIGTWPPGSVGEDANRVRGKQAAA
jgi:hypothetical protein